MQKRRSVNLSVSHEKETTKRLANCQKGAFCARLVRLRFLHNNDAPPHALYVMRGSTAFIFYPPVRLVGWQRTKK